MDMGLIGYFVCFLHVKSELGLRRVIKNPPSYSHRVIIAIVGLVTKKNLEFLNIIISYNNYNNYII